MRATPGGRYFFGWACPRFDTGAERPEKRIEVPGSRRLDQPRADAHQLAAHFDIGIVVQQRYVVLRFESHPRMDLREAERTRAPLSDDRVRMWWLYIRQFHRALEGRAHWPDADLHR